MFLKPYRVIPAEFSVVRAVVLGQREIWLDDSARAAAEQRQRQLLAQAGLAERDHLGYASVRLGSAHDMEQVISVPLFVGGADPGALGSAPESTLEAAWLAPGMTHLALTGSYSLAPTDPGDRALIHRVLEAAALHFLDLVADRLVTLASA